MFKIPDAVLKEGFQEVIDQDFNPDIVKCFGMDMWEGGCKFGLLMGAACAAGTMLGIYLGGKLAKKHISKRKSEFNKMADEMAEFEIKDLKLK